jgi:DNA-binding MarR family transcriptional regulator
MIIFLNDDAAYRWWIGHHRGGFVLDGRRRPKLGHLVLHRATCGEISSYHSTRRHWTTGSRLKAVSLNREELIVWGAAETGRAVTCCATCRPDQQLKQHAASAGALPKLAREVLDYVLEAALIHMEHQQPPYRLTLGEIAACFGKTPGQVTPVVGRLIDEGWLTLVGPPAARRKLRRGVVAPTVQAMRSLAAFQAETDAAIQAELEKLNGERRTSVPLVQSL